MAQGRLTPCLIALGSNSGDRAAHLRFAIRSLDRLPGTHLRRASSFHHTAPVGPGRQRSYLNAAAMIETRFSPLGLLVELKRLEAARGRRPGPRWSSRTLDCDILFYGEQRVRKPYLRLPHPRALTRGFVLAPLAELRPHWKPPGGGGRSVRELLIRLNRPPQGTAVR